MTRAEREERYRAAKERVNTRIKQWEIVENGEPEEAAAMAIFLGKQYLGQKEEPEEVEVPPEEWEEFFRDLIGENEGKESAENEREGH